MLKEFEDIYDIHPWLRFLTWLGLVCMALFLVWAFRQVTRGSFLLHPFPLVAALSAGWFMLCAFVIWLSLALIRHHLKQWKILDRKLFKQRVNEEWVAARESFLQQSDNLYNGSRASSLLWDYAGNGPPTRLSGDPLMGLQLPQKSQMSGETTERPAVPARRSNTDIPTRPATDLSSNADVPTRPATVSRAAPMSSPARPPVAEATKKRAAARVGVGWNRGIRRRHAPNEDGVAAIQGTCTYKNHIVPFDLFLVADGMGGHADGQEASRIAIKVMTQVVLQSIMVSDELADSSFIEVLINGVQQANLAIWKRNREQSSDMGTTLTAALVAGPKAYVVNVGDSRTYLFRPVVGLSAVTRDHSLVARLVASGAISPEEIYTYPGRNVIERSLGNSQHVKADSFIVTLSRGDWLLLCSDGLWEMVRDPQIERIMQGESDPTRMSDLLIQAALKGGGADNVSVIVAQVA